MKLSKEKVVFLSLLFAVFCSCSRLSKGSSSSDSNSSAIVVKDAQVTSSANGTQLIFQVSLSQALPAAVSLNYQTTGESAIAGTHFTSVSGTLSFPAGTTSQQVVVPVLADTSVCNPARTLTLSVGVQSGGASLAQVKATGTIVSANERSGELSKSETWSCVVHLTQNTSIDGAKITVAPSGGIEFDGDGLILQLGAAADGTPALELQGSASAPVLISTASGHLPGYLTTKSGFANFANFANFGGWVARYAHFSRVGDSGHPAISALLGAGKSVTLQNSEITSSGEIQITSQDTTTGILIQNNNFTSSQGPNAVAVHLFGNTGHLIDSNSMDAGVFINTYGTPGATISNNVLIGPTSIAAYGQGIIVTDNFIHETTGAPATAALQIEADNSTVTGNYVRGGYWSIFAEGTGGTFENNIFESTSEITNQILIASMPSASLWKGNLLRGASVWESVWIDSASGITFRNNVLDTLSSVGLWMNRSGALSNTINFRNNVLIGVGTGVYDQPGQVGDVSFIDYNAFFHVSAADYSNILISGLVQGSSLGFGGHDVHADPLFANRAVTLSIIDSSLMSRSATVAQALSQIRAGYRPLSGSPLIGAGDPQDDGDPDVTGGSRDIGAIQH